MKQPGEFQRLFDAETLMVHPTPHSHRRSNALDVISYCIKAMLNFNKPVSIDL